MSSDEKSTSIFSATLHDLLERGVKRVEVAREPGSPGGGGHLVMLDHPYLIACVDGVRDYRFLRAGRAVEASHQAGECLYFAPGSWVAVMRQHRQRAICITFGPQVTRFVLVDFDPQTGALGEPMERAIAAQHFAPVTLDQLGLSVAEALTLPASSRYAAKFERNAGEMLLIKSLGMLDSAPVASGQKAQFTWQTARLFVEENCHASLSRETVAAHLHLSASHVSKLFSQRGGESFSDHLRRVRLERALRLLRDSTLNIGEVARASGFDDANYFARCFRARYGQTPSQARRIAAEDAKI